MYIHEHLLKPLLPTINTNVFNLWCNFLTFLCSYKSFYFVNRFRALQKPLHKCNVLLLLHTKLSALTKSKDECAKENPYLDPYLRRREIFLVNYVTLTNKDAFIVWLPVVWKMKPCINIKSILHCSNFRATPSF